MGLTTIDGQRLETEWIAGTRAGAPPLVFLHEGLGSIALWRDFPARVAAATGCPALVYSRRGYGKSDPIAAPRAVDYMHVEAIEVLPALLAAFDIAAPVLVGHSDGASIALIHAGTGRWPVRGVVAMAPHVFVEDVTVTSIEGAREAWRTTDLKTKLGRYHDDVEGAFRGWNDIWLHPDFLNWNIEDYLPGIACPVMVIQGADDEYGTLAQLDAIDRGVKGGAELVVLERCKHSPHRDRAEETLAAIVRFVDRA